jgi:endonuclease G
MAKFRSNHTGSGKRDNKKSGFIIKAAVYGMVLLFFLWKLLNYFKAYENNEFKSVSADTVPLSQPEEEGNKKVFSAENAISSIDLPSQTLTNTLVRHRHFTLSYSESNEQAEWVAYELTRDKLNAPKVGRFDYFSPDHDILTRSALHRDYTGSGYTRGHLAPAADMAFDQKAAEESFYMSNISPQEKYFNQGVWRELEENVRDWARSNRSLFIVTGPVLTQGIIKKIGENRVSVPYLFYKVVLDTTGIEKKGIGFVLPNKKSELPLEEYMVTIDSVEVLTQLNFFNPVNKNSNIEVIESKIDKSAWPVNAARYKKRINEWNKN